MRQQVQCEPVGMRDCGLGLGLVLGLFRIRDYYKVVKYTSICMAQRRYYCTSNSLRHGSHRFTCKLHHACLGAPGEVHHPGL